MGYKLHDVLNGLLIFFCVLNTITVGLRLYVRTTLNKGAFGRDDIALVITYVGLILLAAMVGTTIHYGYRAYDDKPWHNAAKARQYNAAMDDTCYIISGTVKISVALVLYRLDPRRFVRFTLIADMLICCVWTVAAVLILSLGCTDISPYSISQSVCRNTRYSQEASYVMFDFFHVMLAVIILWHVQIRKLQKLGIVCLFAVGLLAAIAAIMKLQVYVEIYHPTADQDDVDLWYRAVIWAFTEHGLSIFACSILALRPLAKYVSKGWASLSSSLYGGGSTKNSSTRGTTQSQLSKASKPSEASSESAELHAIGVRNDISVYREYNVADQLKHPVYSAEAYNESSDSQKKLIEGQGGPSKAADDFV